ncbi:RNA-dependent RNA polymerase [Botryosphaeria dothidea victorivirus 1]|uniref:RNA-directed RNA polymerase n=1 Tax=Botryosphaeria dothidea victorivirus 1 TaxID=1547580 RepID=A0A089G446_9VIRU|nr:RNA-dependent RNA polymerase [Botryosphaeria dothidea victorivirus 1]AIP92361.1 RNA-dependent RNA polymerase [Botryosphaeria dothidea victorivirus 1]
MQDAVAVRAAEVGPLGVELLRVIDTFAAWTRTHFPRELVAGMSRLQVQRQQLDSIHPLLAPAIATLLLDYPLQLELDHGVVMRLVDLALPRIDAEPAEPAKNQALRQHVKRNSPRHNQYMELASAIRHDKPFRLACFPEKKLQAATAKKNFSTRRLLDSVSRELGASFLGWLVAHCACKVTDDQFQMIIIFGLTLSTRLGRHAYLYALSMVTNPSHAKSLNVVLKGLGANASTPGCWFVEGQGLLGRGVGDVDWNSEIPYRCDPDLVREKTINVDPETIRPHIRAILERELVNRNDLPDMEDFWTSRWLWCVNGSQTSDSDKALGLDLKTLQTHRRRYRRMAAEALVDNPIPDWDGTTYVSASSKLEVGKTRAIFACDTRSYFAFSYLLNQVQKDWRNERVLLDPGNGGTVAMGARLRNAQKGGGFNLMLDYDDFNSQHSTETMKIVFEETCKIYNAPAWYTDKLCSSFDKMYIRQKDGLRHVAGTLMSGHRGTTFINSVLNAAYLRCGVGSGWFDHALSLHTGDDVYIRSNSRSEVSNILTRAAEFGCRMNPTKQSIGVKNCEFLRCAYNPYYAVGYLCRTVGTLVNGNWSGDTPLTPHEALTSLLTSLRSLYNRSLGGGLGRYLASAIRFRTDGISRKNLIGLLDGRIAIEGGPCFNADAKIRTCALKNTIKPSPLVDKNWDAYATRDYLVCHTTDLEYYALQNCGVSPTPLMVTTSYEKGLNRESEEVKPLKFCNMRVSTARGFATVSELLKVDTEGGVLAHYPLLMLIKDSLSPSLIRELCEADGYTPPSENIRAYAFGEDFRTHNIIGRLPYSDAAALQGKTSCDNIVADYKIYL